MSAIQQSLFAGLSPESVATPLKWAGGKRWLVPKLVELYEPYRDRYLVEPFAGAMSVVLALRPTQAILNDANPHLINFWQHAREGVMQKELDNVRLANDKETYYANRERFNQSIRDELGEEYSRENAWLFYYLNRTGFNGLCRFNKSGEFNVPFGKHKTINYRCNFDDIAAIINEYQLSNIDFEKVVPSSGAFIYADPPYYGTFTAYDGNPFDWNDQVRLMEWLRQHDGPVVASNSATDEVLKLYEAGGFEIELIDAPRAISCKGDGRKETKEMLATRNM